ncbi:MAG: hypothetical protein DWI28_01915 [Planctomycetota bacterium]|nr:MAG: hypothetical protein DWI28_01915 [Planctomycetota bacterium]
MRAAAVARGRCLRFVSCCVKPQVRVGYTRSHSSQPKPVVKQGEDNMTISMGLDVGSNSVGSAWIDHKTGKITVGLSIFPAGVDESDEKRGDPKNAKRRATRRSRITLARRAQRKRLLRLKLISVSLLPADAAEFKELLQDTDPWELRRKALAVALSPFEFGRVLLHLAQRRGALGLRIIDPDDPDATDSDREDGKVKKAIGEVQSQMRKCGARTYGEFIAQLRDTSVTQITTPDNRPKGRRNGPREYRSAVRNKAGSYKHCADRTMIRDEFAKLWEAQKRLGGPLAEILSGELRLALDDDARNSDWRHKGLLFGQRMQTWDLGTLGRCVLEPTERCVAHADSIASRYLVVETINNLKIIERGKQPRSLAIAERSKIKNFLSEPLGEVTRGKQKGQPKRSVTVTDLRDLMGWGNASKTSAFRFNIEADKERSINTDWFSREIIHGAITAAKWQQLSLRSREGINRAILKHDPDDETHDEKLKALVMQEWAGLKEAQADLLVAAWKKRPRPDAKRLSMSRRAVRNLLTVMDRDEPWPDADQPGETRWLTQIEARKRIAKDENFLDVTTGNPLDEHARRRYVTGTKGATARDRHYMKKHLLMKNKEPVYGPDGLPLHEPPPAPLISNPVVRKTIHEVRRHIIDYLTNLGCKPDEIHVELAREAKMGKKDSDRVLFMNRLRNRIRNDIIDVHGLSAVSATQQRAAVERVVLSVQQDGVCPLCGNQKIKTKITPRMAANGEGCEVAHIIPKASGGHNGLGNLVLAHTACNRDMGRRTPRQYWEATLSGGFDEGFRWIEGIYADIQRPSPWTVNEVSGDALWLCYFAGGPSRWGPTYDGLKIGQFKKDIKDIQEMTERQGAATKYAARQVMTYLADALYDGKGLPERSTGTEQNPETRRIFANDGLWTSRLRREWGLFFDRHGAKAHGLTNEQEHELKEKNRGDHRHHAIDAIVIALCSERVRKAWDARELAADQADINTANEEAMDNYRRQHPLPLPMAYKSRDELRAAVQLAVFGEGPLERPVAHRPVKRKLIGALHEETLFGPVVDRAGSLTANFSAKKSVLQLDPNHLRRPRRETEKKAIERLALLRLKEKSGDEKTARKWARSVVSSLGYQPAIVDPPPGKSGIVRDIALRLRIRDCLSGFQYAKRNKNGEQVGEARSINPDDFTDYEIKQAFEAGAICQASGVPINSVVLLRTMSGPVVIDRKRPDYATGKMVHDDDPASKRAYLGGNNHHVEIRVAKNKKGDEVWSGQIVTAFEAAQRKLTKLRAFREAGIPKLKVLRKLSKAERAKFHAELRRIETAHPVIDRCENVDNGGKFVMSLCEGEMLKMKHKQTGEVGYFVVAKLDKPQSIVVVPHWDARAATERKGSDGKKVADSKREQFAVTPSDLKDLAPPGEDHAVKVRVSPLGKLVVLTD